MRTPEVLILTLLLLVSAVPVQAQAPHAFSQRCAVCHQPTGAGIPGIYPPIAGTIGAYVRVPQGRTFLVHLLLYGMTGAITAHGMTYEGFMPSAADIADSDLAEAINYVLRKLNASELARDFKPFTAAELKAGRGQGLTPQSVYQEREKLIATLGASKP